jgi:hypothetical protein
MPWRLIGRLTQLAFFAALGCAGLVFMGMEKLQPAPWGCLGLIVSLAGMTAVAIEAVKDVHRQRTSAEAERGADNRPE